MAHKQHFVVPGPDEICPAGVAWGSGNRWIEPWGDDAGETGVLRLRLLLLLLLLLFVAAVVWHVVSWYSPLQATYSA
jgi:hypothetical protein